MRGKRIIIVSDSFPPVPSGVSKYAYFLAKKLQEMGNRVIVMTGRVTEVPKEDQEIRDLGGDVVRFGRILRVYANGSSCYITALGPGDLTRMRSFLKETDHDVVVIQGPLGLTLPYPVTIFSGAKKVGVFHSSTDKPNLGFLLFRWFMRPFLEALDVKIAVSARAKEEIERYFGKQDFQIIPPGVDTSLYSPAAGEKQVGALNFLFLGRLDERKGVDVLLRAWRNAPKVGVKNGKKVEINLLIGGDGPMRKLVEREVGRFRNVRYLGFIKEDVLPSLYASADVSIFPSKGGESFGIVLIESMACGTPPVASNIGGYRDVVEDGKSGLLFSSEKELVEKLLFLSTNEEVRNELSHGALEHAMRYDWNIIARRIQELL